MADLLEQQPTPETTIAVQHEHLDALSRENIRLKGVLRDIHAEFNGEIGRLREVFSQIVGMLPDDEARATAHRLLRGEPLETPVDEPIDLP